MISLELDIENFNPTFDVVSILLKKENGTFLLLQRAASKPQGLTWGSPTGKVEPSENRERAIEREVGEETGIDIDFRLLTFHHTFYVRYDDYDFTYHLYSYPVSDDIHIILENGCHIACGWYTPLESLELNLIEDMDFVIKQHFNLQHGNSTH